MANKRRKARRSPTYSRKRAEDHLGLVYEAARIMFRKPGEWDVFDFGDLVSIGYIGLISAIRTYRADGGRTFANHAIRRICGEIKDAARLWHHSRRKNAIHFEDESQLRRLAADVHSPLQNAENSDAVAFILSQLSGDAHRAMSMRATSGITDRDICRKLGKCNSYFIVMVKQIRRRLEKSGAFN